MNFYLFFHCNLFPSEFSKTSIQSTAIDPKANSRISSSARGNVLTKELKSGKL